MSIEKEPSETAAQLSVTNGNATEMTAYSVFHDTPTSVFRLEGDFEGKESYSTVLMSRSRSIFISKLRNI